MAIKPEKMDVIRRKNGTFLIYYEGKWHITVTAGILKEKQLYAELQRKKELAELDEERGLAKICFSIDDLDNYDPSKKAKEKKGKKKEE